MIELSLRRWRRSWWRPAVHAEWHDFRTRIVRESYDSVVDLQGLTKSALAARLARDVRYRLANRTEGSSHEWPARRLANRAIRVETHSHAVDRSRELVGRVLGRVPSGQPCYGLRATVRASDPTVVFVHGTSGADKLWPDAHWIELGRRLTAEGRRIALPHSGAAESARAEAIASAIGEGCSVWPSMPLDLLLDAMASAEGVIGDDGGLGHLAVALDPPHVQIDNLATAWRTGPRTAGGEPPHQVAIVGNPAPGVGAVARAWQVVPSAASGR